MSGIQDDTDNALVKNNSNNNLGGLFPLNSNDFGFLNPTVLNNSLLYNFPSIIEKSNQLLNPSKGSSFSNTNNNKLSPVEENLKNNTSDKLVNSNPQELSNKSSNQIKSEAEITVENKTTGKKRFMKAYEKVTDTK
jgi:hypothetical protein